MTRRGKIARLPHAIREQLNTRLQDGEMAKHLVTWLNAQPEVREVLAKEFQSRPISEQNLSEWKQGGYEEWLRHQATLAWIQTLAENARDLEAAGGGIPLAEHLATALAVALGKLLQTAMASTDPAEQQKAVLSITRQVAQLRRGNHDTERVRLQRERWEKQQEEAEEEKQEKERKKAKWAAQLEEIKKQEYLNALDQPDWGLSNGTTPPDILRILLLNEKLRKEHEAKAAA